MNAPTCSRCGAPFEPRRANDRRCVPCEQQVAALIAPKAEPKWLPLWRRVGLAKSLSGLPS